MYVMKQRPSFIINANTKADMKHGTEVFTVYVQWHQRGITQRIIGIKSGGKAELSGREFSRSGTASLHGEYRQEHWNGSIQGLYKNWLCYCIHSNTVWLKKLTDS